MHRSQLKIHTVGVESTAALASLDACASDFPWRKEQFATALNNGGSILVLQEAGQLCGFILCSVVLEEATVLNIAVHPNFQREGRARCLLDMALEKLRDQGNSRCLLEVRESNVAARRLYEQCGFVVDGVRKNYYPGIDGREHAILMSRPL